ncbi:TIGR01212 family radical SAM protein [Helicobacter sp. T3_23-1056]
MIDADFTQKPLRELRTIGRYFKQRFGERVRKIPISLSGFTCPNIDGSKARGGCIYCDNASFSPSFIKIQNPKIYPQNLAPKSIPTMNFSLQSNPILDTQLAQLEEQFLWHADFHKRKFGVKKYMVYFQSFSNTYAHPHTLKSLWDKALNFEGVVGLNIGTRIDCVENATLEILSDYVKEGKEIWLEYGVQSAFDSTLNLINRAHSTKGAKELFNTTRKKGIKVCAHLIYGLPNEDKSMMIDSLKTTLQWGIDALKIHPLYVIAGTKLAKMYEAGKYEPIDLDCYVELVAKSMMILPSEVIIERVSSGAHIDSLIAPKWCFDKNIQMRLLREKLLEMGIRY